MSALNKTFFMFNFLSLMRHSCSPFDTVLNRKVLYRTVAVIIERVRGATDNASDYGSEDSRFESWRARTFCQADFCALEFSPTSDYTARHPTHRFYGVMVSTQDSESCDPSSNLGRTF